MYLGPCIRYVDWGFGSFEQELLSILFQTCSESAYTPNPESPKP